ncbi:hypothetical protein KCU89_g120, partial [Aureobasidium melanogenum]
MALLRKLKSLSESTRFELFANYDEATSAAIQNLCKIQAGMAVSPSVILEKLYSSKQSGCINMWVEQGSREQGLVKKCAVAARKDAEPVNKSHDVFGPPQYEPQAPSSGKPLSPQSRHQAPLQAGLAWTGDHSLRTSPDLPSTAPPYSTHAELNSPLHDITYQHASAAAPASRDFPSPAMVTQPNRGRMLPTSPLRDPATPAPTSSHNYIATFLSGFPGYSNCVPVVSTGHDGLASSTNCSVLGRNRDAARMTREKSFARVEVSATDPGNAAPTFAGTLWDTISQIADSPTRKRRLSQSSNNEMARPANRPFHTSSHAMHGSYDVLSSTMPDSLTYHDVQTEPGQVTADRDTCSLPQRASLLSSWLLEAWKHCPDAHHVLEVELLRLAAAINHSTCYGDVTADRVACTFALIDHCTRQGSIKCSHGGLDTDRDIATDLLTLTTWLYEMHPRADMEYFSSLSQLSLTSIKDSQTMSKRASRVDRRSSDTSFIVENDILKLRGDDFLQKEESESDERSVRITCGRKLRSSFVKAMCETRELGKFTLHASRNARHCIQKNVCRFLLVNYLWKMATRPLILLLLSTLCRVIHSLKSLKLIHHKISDS